MVADRRSPTTGRGERRRRATYDKDGLPGALSPRIKLNRDWLYEKTDDAELAREGEQVHDATEGAFTVLARFGAAANRGQMSPLSRWRRSAIRIAANNAARRLREAARLKALQRTPYPLVLARIKLLLDRLQVFKEHINTMSSGRLSPSAVGSRSRKRLAAAGAPPPPLLLQSSTMRRESTLRRESTQRREASPDGGGRGSALGPPAARDGDGSGAEEEEAVESVIRNWDLRKAGGHLPSGPMEVLSRKPSRMIRESRSPGAGSSDDDTDYETGSGSGGGGRSRGRSRSGSPSRSVAGGGPLASGGGGVFLSNTVAAAAAALRAGAAGDERERAVISPYDRYGETDLPYDYAESLAMDDPGSGNKMSLDKLLEELSTTMSYVSDFLRKVPEETRMEACFAAKMENYKKDQTVYRIGDPPERFHLILTGVVEIWTHPPGNRREKTLIATLKKGQSFGEMAILNDEPRAEVATPTSNCTFLTFQRVDLLSTFGPFFRERLLEAEQFFHSRVAVFQAMPKSHTLRVISHMMQSTFPAGKDWEPLADQQIYFIKSGAASLEALDRRFAATAAAPAAPAASRATAAATVAAAAVGPGAIPLLQGLQALTGGAPVEAEEGEEGEENARGGGGAGGSGGGGSSSVNEVLAAISIVDGRAVGTLGHEDELRRLRRALIPKKAVATLEAGSHFGGGVRILGEGELQSCMKITASTEITLYHMHIDQFFKCASPELVRALRDDTAFKLTYYFGRLGTIGQDMVVGHSDASLTTRGGVLQDEESVTAAARGASGPRKKKGERGGKKLGGHSTEVEKVIAYMAELEAELDNPGTKNVDLYKNGTPAERYYRNPLLCGTARGNALPHLIAGVYGDGLAPLADKVESLAVKAARRLDVYHGDQPAVARMHSIMAPPTSSSGLGSPHPSSPISPHGRASAPQRLPSPGYVAMAVHSGSGGGGAVTSSPGSLGPPTAPFGPAGARPSSPLRFSSRMGPVPGRASVNAIEGNANGGGGGGTAAGGDAFATSAAAAVAAAALGSGGVGRAAVPSLAPLNAGAGTAGAGLIGRHVGGVGWGQLRHDSNGANVQLRPHSSPHSGGGGGSVFSGGSDAMRASRPGALIAAGFMWQHMRDVGGRAPPQIRQCLTYDEIAHVKAEAKRALSGGGGSPTGTSSGGGRPTPPPGGLSAAPSGFATPAGGVSSSGVLGAPPPWDTGTRGGGPGGGR